MDQELSSELASLLERIVAEEAARLRKQRDDYDQSILDSARLMAPLMPALLALRDRCGGERGISFSIPEHRTSCSVTINGGSVYQHYALFASSRQGALVLEYSYLENYGDCESSEEHFESQDGVDLLERIVAGVGKQIAANRVSSESQR